MSVPIQTLRLHLDYSAWASNRLLDAIAPLSPEELARDFGTADKNVLDTLVHVFAADRIWLTRVRGTSPVTLVLPEDRNVAALRINWPALQEDWRGWAAALTDEQVAETISYRDMKGNHWRQPLWQIILHVVNHGTHHRGAVAGFLRTMGYAPPPLDLIAFYREFARDA